LRRRTIGVHRGGTAAHDPSGGRLGRGLRCWCGRLGDGSGFRGWGRRDHRGRRRGCGRRGAHFDHGSRGRLGRRRCCLDDRRHDDRCCLDDRCRFDSRCWFDGRRCLGDRTGVAGFDSRRGGLLRGGLLHRLGGLTVGGVAVGGLGRGGLLGGGLLDRLRLFGLFRACEPLTFGATTETIGLRFDERAGVTLHPDTHHIAERHHLCIRHPELFGELVHP
jgi:hypothetical protein